MTTGICHCWGSLRRTTLLDNFGDSVENIRSTTVCFGYSSWFVKHRIPMTDMSMRADPSRAYPGRTYRFFTGDPVYGFGHGLSYTDFAYELLSAPTKLSLSGSFDAESRGRITRRVRHSRNYVRVHDVGFCDSLKFNVRVAATNKGEMDGTHVVMLFSRAPGFLKGSPKKQLIGFDCVDVVSYGFKEVSMTVDPCEHLSVVDESGKRLLPLGNHTLLLSDMEHIISIEA